MHAPIRLSSDVSRWQSPDVVSWRGQEAATQPGIWRNAWWALLQLVGLAALCYAAWRLVGHTPYRIDIDVYRMGGQAWLDGRPLYDDGVEFHTPIGLNLPFTYPPLAAIVFSPFAWLGLPVASVTITLITLALLLVSTMILLTRLDLWRNARVVPGPAWLRRWLLTTLRAAAHRMPTRAAAGTGDCAQAHSGGVPAVFPAEPR